MTLIPIILLLLIGAGIFAAVYFVMRARREQAHEEWRGNRKTILLKILVPKNNEKTPKAAENLFAALHGIYRPDADFHDHLSFEIVASNKAIEFYVQCPAELRDFVEGQIYAQYPSVEMHEIGDYARIDQDKIAVASTELTLNKNDIFPIKTFENFEVDPLAGITAVLSKTNPDEHIWIQMLIRPISDDWQNRSNSYVTAARNGTLQGKSFFMLLLNGLVDVFRGPTSTAEPAKSDGPPKLPSNVEQALKAAEEKATKLGYATKIRILAVAGDQTTAATKITSLTGVFKQFNTINMNGFAPGKLTNDTHSLEVYRLRQFEDKGNILNIQELASVFHFPNQSVETPSIVWAGSKKGEPPATLPAEGSISPDELTVYGQTDFRGHKQRFGIKVGDRRLHMYALGKSGTGKSTMLENMAIDDIRKGRGIAIVDPHGDFVNSVLDFVPASRINDVIYFNPADRDFAIGFNLLENVNPELKNIVASGLMSIFTKLWANVWSARMEYILRNTIMALLEYPNATMLTIMQILNDAGFRAKVMEHVKDPVIRDFFINEYNKWDPKFRQEAIAAIQNKVGQFLSSSTIRNIVGQPVSTFDIGEAMNARKILLFDLSIGKIGEDAAALLGAMMITKIQLAAMSRANIENKEERVDFYLYVDEFQNFATDAFATILSEARKYRLNMILTHQYIGQLPETVTKAIFGNVGTMVSFRVGSSDAVALVKEFEPVFDANDLVNLDNHHIYVKMSIDGVMRPAFSAVTLPPSAEKNSNKEKIIRISRERYSRPREMIEKMIMDQSLESSGNREATGPRSFHETDDGETPRPAKPKGQGLPPLNVEGKWYQSHQDKQGRHWYFQLSDEEVSEQKLVDTDGGDTPLVETTTPPEVPKPAPTLEEKVSLAPAPMPLEKPVASAPKTDETSQESNAVKEALKPVVVVPKPPVTRPVSHDRPSVPPQKDEPKQAPARAPEPAKKDESKPVQQSAPKEQPKSVTPIITKELTPSVKTNAASAPSKMDGEVPNSPAPVASSKPKTDVVTLKPNETIILRD